MKHILFAICVVLLFALLLSWAVPIGQSSEQEVYPAQCGYLEPRVVETLRVEVKEIIKEVYVGVENLREFPDEKTLRAYVCTYRTTRMKQWGLNNCEDYAYDFMVDCLKWGYICSTEILTNETLEWHMVNTLPIGDWIYLVDIACGEIEQYALKD